MTLSMRDEQLKLQLFRFVAVLPSLHTSDEIIEHLQEYFADGHESRKVAQFLGVGIRLAGIAPWISGPILRWNVSEMARQFIAGRNPIDVMRTLRKRQAQNIGFTVAILREAVVRDTEPDENAERHLDLIEEEFKDWLHAGIVIQAYLRDSDADLRDLIEWGRARGTRFAVRLVKGAYWDYETTKSRQNGWDCPVYLQKPESDANFEMLTRLLLENESIVTSAFGSHNVRSIAHAQALAEQLGIDRSRFE